MKINFREAEEISIRAFMRLAEMLLADIGGAKLPVKDSFDFNGRGEVFVEITSEYIEIKFGCKRFRFFYNNTVITSVTVFNERDMVVAERIYENEDSIH